MDTVNVPKSKPKYRVKREVGFRHHYVLQRRWWFVWVTVNTFTADHMEHAVHLAKMTLNPPIAYLD